MEYRTNIHFEPVAHKYTDDSGKEYTSVTTVIGKYKPIFDKRYWGMYTALKECNFNVAPVQEGKFIRVNGVVRSIDSLYSNPINNYEVQRVVNKWNKLTKEACARGNEIHDFLEDSINESKEGGAKTNDVIKPQLGKKYELVTIRTVHDLDKTPIRERFPSIYTRLLGYIRQGCTLYAEKRIYSTTYQIAGMIDVLIVKGKQFMIMDWKTNKDELKFISGYYKKIKFNGKWIKGDQFIRTFKTLLSPVNNLEDCKGNIYSLQLSLYAYIMTLWGYKLVKNGLEIFHIRPGLEPKLIKVQYMEQEITNMLNHHAGNNNTRKFGLV